MASANEISQYSGNSEFAGGLGATGTQQMITGVWKMADTINLSIAQLQAQEFKRNKDLYDQRIKDRDAVATMIKDGSFNTTDLDEKDRTIINAGVKELKDDFIKVAKNGNMSDADYLRLNENFTRLKQQADLAKADFLTIKADRVLNDEMYDKDAVTKTTTKAAVDPITGETVSTATTTKEENVRRSSENQKKYEKHMADYYAAKAKDPNVRYKPFVPVSRINYDVAFPQIGVDVEEKPVGKEGWKVEVTTTPSFKKTAEIYGQNWSDPQSRQHIQRAYDQITEGIGNGDVASITAVTDANKKIMEINSKSGYGMRNDGTIKGNGYFGPLKMKNGNDATEISIGVEFDGKETEIPTLVPTLSEAEKKWLLDGNNPNDKSKTGEAIVSKAIDHAKKRMDEGQSPFADNPQGLPLITKDTNVPLTMALLNYTRQYDKVPKPETKYVGNGKAMELAAFNTDENIRQQKEVSNINTKDNVSQYRQQKEIDKQYATAATDPKVSSALLTEVFKARSEAINLSKMSDDDKQVALKALQDEILLGVFSSGEAVKTRDKNGNIVGPNNLPHKGTSTALGTFGILEDSGHGKDAFLNSPLFSVERKKYKSYNEYYKFLATNADEHNKVFSPKYLKYLESKAGKDVNAQLAYNYGGNEGLKQYKAGNLSYVPEGNKNTLAQHIANSLEYLKQEPATKKDKKTKKTADDLLEDVGL